MLAIIISQISQKLIMIKIMLIVSTTKQLNSIYLMSIQSPVSICYFIWYYIESLEMALRIKINQKLDSKLLQNFPNDPYTDITIQLQYSTLNLSLAYLSIDSQRFADLSSDVTNFDLSQFDQVFAIAVLQSLYGGPLDCTSVDVLENLWPIIEYLQIAEYKENIAKQIKVWLQKREGSLGILEWVDVCIRMGILKEWIVDWLTQQKLKPLESTKNYLQLSKLSDFSLNYILLEFIGKEKNSDLVVNVIMENYFNRKGYSPHEYLQKAELAPLNKIWESFHYRLKPKLQKAISIQSIALSTISPFTKEKETPKTVSKAGRPQPNNFNFVSVNLGEQLHKPQKLSEGYLLDMRISVLSNQLEQKDRKIEMLKEQLRELEELRAKKMIEEEASDEQSMVDIALLKSRMRSRKEKQILLESGSQYAFDNACKKMEQQRQQKLKLFSKSNVHKKA